MVYGEGRVYDLYLDIIWNILYGIHNMSTKASLRFTFLLRLINNYVEDRNKVTGYLQSLKSRC